jgi:peroxidase
MTKGAHIIGYAMCTFFRSRIYNDTNIDTCFAQSTQSNCPTTSGLDYDNVAPLDLQTSNTFNNYYYKNLIKQKGLLHSDQEPYSNGSTDSQVQSYSTN